MKIIFVLLFLVSTSVSAQIEEFFTMFDNWNLKSGIVNGESFSVPVNDEVYPVTISFSNDTPNYSTTVCGTATGGMIAKNGFELIFTTDVTITDEVCNLASNNDFQELYFQFFLTHENETVNYSLIIVDFAPNQFPEYIIILEADNGDELFFSDIPLLNTDAFELLKTVIYPNPTNDFIRVESLENLELEYNLFDYSGKLLSKGSLLKNKTIDLSSLSLGNYFLVLNTHDGKKAIQKIVKD